MKRKTLSLSEKIKLIDFAKTNPTFGCRKIGEIHRIGKTSVTCILKDEVISEKNLKCSKVLIIISLNGCCYDLI